MRIDRALVRAWRRVNRCGAVVVALRFDSRGPLATALIEELATGRRFNAMGGSPADALDRCATQLS